MNKFGPTGALGAFLAMAVLLAQPSTEAVLKTSADIAEVGYQDSLATARTLAGAIDDLIANPTQDTLEAARNAWCAARVPYQQTEAYSFGNAIVDDWEGRVNAWPLEEGLIDYVDASYGTESDEDGGHDDGGYVAAILDGRGGVLCEAELPGRGHGSVWSARGDRVVVFARRPGHVRGRAGRLLFTTENDLNGPRGVIGIWDVADGFRRVGEAGWAGIGPHDVALTRGGRTLVAADGGILNHPDTGRMKLNLAEMDPSIAFLDLATGTVERTLRLPRELHKLSIRHLAMNRAGRIGAAMQYEGSREDQPPLVLVSDGSSLETLEAPAAVARRMKAYCGDIAMDGAGAVMAASAPRGNLVTFWSVDDGRFLESCPIEDGCGLAPLGPAGRFLLTSGAGERAEFDVASGRLTPIARDGDRRWDNHVGFASGVRRP